jgi:hypothetical protein
MERLRDETFQRLFFDKLTAAIRSSLCRFNLAHKDERKKGMLGSGLIDTLFYYFQLLESLVRAMESIDVRYSNF